MGGTFLSPQPLPPSPPFIPSSPGRFRPHPHPPTRLARRVVGARGAGPKQQGASRANPPAPQNIKIFQTELQRAESRRRVAQNTIRERNLSCASRWGRKSMGSAVTESPQMLPVHWEPGPGRVPAWGSPSGCLTRVLPRQKPAFCFSALAKQHARTPGTAPCGETLLERRSWSLHPR